MSEYIIFPIGDWSCDGHNSYADFLVKSEKPLQEVRETHLKENVFIGSLCSDYEDNKIEVQCLYEFLIDYIGEEEAKNVLQKLVNSNFKLIDEEQEFNRLIGAVGLAKQSIKDSEIKLSFNNNEDNLQFLVIDTPEQMLIIWITILNVINSELKLEIASKAMSAYYIKYKGYPYKPSGDINFCGYDDKGRHLNTPGYGIWKDYEGEFYHAQ